MNAFEILGYVIWGVTTATVLLAGRNDGPCAKPIAWQSRVAWIGFSAFIGTLLGATPLAIVFIGVGLICAIAPRVGEDKRLL